ncbi:MAG: pectin esterase [Ruminococcaceae bacterium]|nr:pectin esterase [Oscillospiraceae bacterium]
MKGEEIVKEITVSPKDDLNEVINNSEPHTRVILSEGVYRQKPEISVPYIELVGAGTDKTVIVYDDYANKIHEDGKEYVTFRTYTIAVTAPHVTFKNLTVENDALKPEEKGQEVALTVYADDFRAENCNFISTQDTIFCGPLPPDLIIRYDGFLKGELRTEGYSRQVYKNCFIAGTVDFIFGCGDALFENCEIKSLYDVRGHGYTAAPAHALEQEIGFVFDRCRFTRDERVADGSIYLARPWRDYGKSSFIDCDYGLHIAAEGFDKWNDTERDKTARFAEYGVPRDGRVPWSRELTVSEKDALLNYFTER